MWRAAVFALTLGGCSALNPFCNVMLAGDFCPALYRMNESSPAPAPSKAHVP